MSEVRAAEEVLTESAVRQIMTAFPELPQPLRRVIRKSLLDGFHPGLIPSLLTMKGLTISRFREIQIRLIAAQLAEKYGLPGEEGLEIIEEFVESAFPSYRATPPFRFANHNVPSGSSRILLTHALWPNGTEVSGKPMLSLDIMAYFLTI